VLVPDRPARTFICRRHHSSSDRSNASVGLSRSARASASMKSSRPAQRRRQAGTRHGAPGPSKMSVNSARTSAGRSSRRVWARCRHRSWKRASAFSSTSHSSEGAGRLVWKGYARHHPNRRVRFKEAILQMRTQGLARMDRKSRPPRELRRTSRTGGRRIPHLCGTAPPNARQDRDSRGFALEGIPRGYRERCSEEGTRCRSPTCRS